MAVTKKVAYYWKEGNNIDFLAVGTQSQLLTADANGAPTWATGITGTTTNDNAATGAVGEYVSSVIASGSAVSLTSGVAKNVTSISLTAGDWDVAGYTIMQPAGGTTVSGYYTGINTTSGSFGTVPSDGVSFSSINYEGAAAVPAAGSTMPLAPCRISIASTTTVYLIAEGVFGVSTMSAYGTINARRVR